MKIEYEVTLEDMVAWSDYHYSHSPTIKRTLLQIRLFCCVAVFASVLLINGVNPLTLTTALLGAAFLAVLMPLRHRSKSKKLTMKLFKEGENKGIIGPRELQATAEGLVSRTAYSESRYSWAMLDKIESSPDHTYLYLGATSALVIPHDHITGGDFRAFMQEIGKHYHPDKKLETQKSEAQLFEGQKLER